ncbi:hypothetical protein [Povalibacter sp.]|uniref:hypothetical protein n=1 Tax=Povalibacter sp. TaxID=1962978 RepID=UPI002F416DD1
MAVPKEYLDWVAGLNDEPADIEDACYIEAHAVSELMDWSPGYSHLQQTQRHVWDPASGSVIFDDTTNWDPDMANVAKQVHMKLSEDPLLEIQFLVDDQIGQVDQPNFDGWTVVRWRVVKSQDRRGELLHHDIIDWEKRTRAGNVTAQSFYSWHVYKPK